MEKRKINAMVCFLPYFGKRRFYNISFAKILFTFVKETRGLPCSMFSRPFFFLSSSSHLDSRVMYLYVFKRAVFTNFLTFFLSSFRVAIQKRSVRAIFSSWKSSGKKNNIKKILSYFLTKNIGKCGRATLIYLSNGMCRNDDIFSPFPLQCVHGMSTFHHFYNY